MSYDLLMVGGSGAQFGLALLECTGLGFAELPRAMYVIDADKGFYQNVLTPGLDMFAEETVALLNHVAEGGQPTATPQLKHVMPYSDPTPKFTVMDLIKGKPMSKLAQVCITDDEANYSIDEGLYGMAKLGGVVLADRAARKDDTRLKGEQGVFPDALIKELEGSGCTGPIFIAGSVAGGTGAGFMAPLLKAIRTAKTLNDRKVHVFSFLPWFELPGSGKSIGPSNSRMALNASQGIRFLQDTLEEIVLTGEHKMLTMVHVIGLPDGAKKPSKDGAMHVGAPGPMMYYAAALLSKGLSAFTDVTFVLQSGVYAWACNPVLDGKGVLSGRVKFRIPVLGTENDNLGDGLVPFEAISHVLEVVNLAIETLTPNRFNSAFGRLSDSPEYLPRVLYDAIKTGRSSTADRILAGMEIRKKLGDFQLKIKEQAKTLQAAQAGVSGDLVVLPEVKDWSRDSLKNVLHINTLLERNKSLPRLLSNAIAQNKLNVAAELVLRALMRGLALGEGGATARELVAKFPPAAATIVALPGQSPTTVHPVPNTPFVRMNAEAVDKLGTILSGNLPPDSQSQPSPLARARLCRFLIENSRLPDNYTFPTGLALADLPEGRLLLIWLGLAAGRWSVCERQRMEGADLRHLNSFDRAVAEFESKDGPQPYRSSWISFVVAKKAGDQYSDADIVAASSPQTGWFTSIRIEEGDNKSYQAFKDLAQDLESNKMWDWLKMAFRGWLDLLAREHAVARNQPWFRMLSLFAGGVATDEDRLKFRQLVWCSVGPLALQVEGGPGFQGNARVVDMSLPLLIDPVEREAIVCALGGTAVQAYAAQPLCVIQQRNGMVELLLKTPTEVKTLLQLRAPQPTAAGLNFEQDLQGGAFAFLNWQGCAGLPRWDAGFRHQFRALATNKWGVQCHDAPLELGHIMIMFGDRPEYAQSFGLDANRYNTLIEMTKKSEPFRPAIINLFNGAQRI
jgi:hypothetical protein